MTSTTLRPGELMQRAQHNTLLGVAALNALAISMTWPLSVLLAEHIGATGASQGWLFAMQGVGMLLSAGITGSLCDRWGKRTVVVGNLALLAMGWLLAFWHQSYATVTAAQVATGMSTAGLTAVSAYVGAHTTVQSRSRAFAYMLAARGVGQVFGPLAVALLLQFGLPVVCLGVVAMSLVTLLCSLALQESLGETEPEQPSQEPPRPWFHRVGVPQVPSTVYLPMLAMVLLWVTPCSVASYLPLHAKEGLGASAETLSLLFSLLGLTMVLTPAVLWVLERWVTERAAALGSFGCMGLAVGAMAVAPSLPMLIVAYTLWALLWDVAYPYVKAAISRQAPAGAQAQVQAAEQFATGGIKLLVGPLSGVLYAVSGANTLFVLACLLSLAGAGVLAPALSRPTRMQAA